MTTIIWKDIDWYPWYRVSNTWLVINQKWKVLSLNKKWNWYFSIRLFNDIWRTQISIHRLVLITFKWIEEWKEVNHINGIKSDNRLENLEWLTRSENVKHRFRILLHKPITKIVIQYDVNWNFIKKWDSIISIERNLWISFQLIWMCCNWKCKTGWWYVWKYFI